MNKIHFIDSDDLVELELKINEWLSSNKEIKFISSNLVALGTPNTRAGNTNGEKYVFFIHYSTAEWENLLSEPSAEEIIPLIDDLETKSDITLTQS